MWEKKNLKRTLHYCQVFTFTIMCVLLNKLLMDLFSWKFVNVSIRVSDLGFVNVSVGVKGPGVHIYICVGLGAQSKDIGRSKDK